MYNIFPLFNYMYLKVIIALRDAYCDQSSLRSGVISFFIPVINRDVLIKEVLMSIDMRTE